MVAAPPGFGETTLLAEKAAALAGPAAARLASAPARQARRITQGDPAVA
jgi:hypothetical protein